MRLNWVGIGFRGDIKFAESRAAANRGTKVLTSRNLLTRVSLSLFFEVMTIFVSRDFVIRVLLLLVNSF